MTVCGSRFAHSRAPPRPHPDAFHPPENSGIRVDGDAMAASQARSIIWFRKVSLSACSLRRECVAEGAQRPRCRAAECSRPPLLSRPPTPP